MASRNRKSKAKFSSNGFDEWGGYMAAKKAKLEDQFSESVKKVTTPHENSKNKGLFDGVAIFVNGYTGNHISIENIINFRDSLTKYKELTYFND